MSTTIFIGVGSNIDPTQNIPGALAALREELEICSSSTFYWSRPQARPEQPRFLNGVWEARTELSPRELKFEVLRQVEYNLGRRRSADKHAPRTIDLDLLVHGDGALREPHMILPDPEIFLRSYIWRPLRELAADRWAALGLAELETDPAIEGDLEPDPQLTDVLRAALTHTTPS